MSESKLRILLADDHAVVRQGLAQILRDALPGAVFGEADTGQEALERVRGEKWDVVVLDISLPDKNGLEVLNEVRQVAPNLPVLILSMHPEEQFAVRTLRAGASGYVTKKTASHEIAEAVRRVLAGGRYVSRMLAEKLAFDAGSAKPAAPHESLSNREYQVFRMLALGKCVKEIAAELSISVQTVSTHRARILEKMEMRTNADLTAYALRERLIQ